MRWVLRLYCFHCGVCEYTVYVCSRYYIFVYRHSMPPHTTHPCSTRARAARAAIQDTRRPQCRSSPNRSTASTHGTRSQHEQYSAGTPTHASRYHVATSNQLRDTPQQRSTHAGRSTTAYSHRHSEVTRARATTRAYECRASLSRHRALDTDATQRRVTTSRTVTSATLSSYARR